MKVGPWLLLAAILLFVFRGDIAIAMAGCELPGLNCKAKIERLFGLMAIVAIVLFVAGAVGTAKLLLSKRKEHAREK